MQGSLDNLSKPIHLLLVMMWVMFLGGFIFINMVLLVQSGGEITSATGSEILDKLLEGAGQVILFFLPAFALVYLFSKSPREYLKFTKLPNGKVLIVGVLMLFAFIPLVTQSMEWNKAIPLPDSLASGVNESEEILKKMYERFLTSKGFGTMLFHLVLIAFIPAICEEFLFRGALQNAFVKAVGNNWKHIAIILTSLIFSLVHIQFSGMIPRFLLGMLLGYSYYFSKNLFVPIILHFVNNGSIVLLSYLYSNQMIDIDPQSTDSLPLTGTIISTAVFLVLGYVFIRLTKKDFKIDGSQLG